MHDFEGMQFKQNCCYELISYAVTIVFISFLQGFSDMLSKGFRLAHARHLAPRIQRLTSTPFIVLTGRGINVGENLKDKQSFVFCASVVGSICIDAIFREVLALIWQRSLPSYCQASSDKTFELRRDCKYLSNSRRSKNITLKHWTWRLFLLQINSFTARNWRQRKQALEVERFFFIVLQYFFTCLFTKSISLPSP